MKIWDSSRKYFLLKTSDIEEALLEGDEYTVIIT